ncbi:hypothetical protein BDR03DRAFT_959935 [Suillus americanus]|nr:hypothetical protein BDR03DRAFT_959935 [Suillus americanus]
MTQLRRTKFETILLISAILAIIGFRIAIQAYVRGRLFHCTARTFSASLAGPLQSFVGKTFQQVVSIILLVDIVLT